MSEYEQFRVQERVRNLPFRSLWEVRFKDALIWVMDTKEDAISLCESLRIALTEDDK